MLGCRTLRIRFLIIGRQRGVSTPTFREPRQNVHVDRSARRHLAVNVLIANILRLLEECGARLLDRYFKGVHSPLPFDFAQLDRLEKKMRRH